MLIVVFFVALLLWLAWALNPALIPYLGIGWDGARTGQWGDSFGGLNAFFAAAGFIAITATLRLQARDLRRQQDQIRKAQIEQQQLRFERTYFELLHLLRDERLHLRFEHSPEFRNKSPIPHGTGPNPYQMGYLPNPSGFSHDPQNKGFGILLEGRMAARGAVKEVDYWLHKSHEHTPNRKEVLRAYQRRVHSRYESSLGPYFRIIYTILYRTKHEASLDDDDREKYGNLLRSQLSSYEVILMALNGLAPFSKDLFELITEFHMLKYTPSGRMRQLLEAIYPPKAFAARS